MIIHGLMLVKSDSKRLKNKNILPFHDKPMFAVNLIKAKKYFDHVYVSTDSLMIAEKAFTYGGIPIFRPKELCGNTPNIKVYRHAFPYMKCDAFVAIQANSPTLDEKIIKKAKEALEKGHQEVMTCWPENPDNPIYGSVWGMTGEKLKNYGNMYKPEPDFLIDDTSVDIHTEADYFKALREYEQNGTKK